LIPLAIMSGREYLFQRSPRTKWSICSRKLADEFPLVSIKDEIAENDWNGWRALTERLGDRALLVGDDVFVTNAASRRASRRRSPTRY
jgi:enolase